MKYNDFRPKTVLFTSLLIFLSLSFMSVIDLLNSLIVWNITDTRKFIEFALIKNFAVGIPAITVFSLWLFKYLTPIHQAFSTLASSGTIGNEQRTQALLHIRRVRRKLIAANLCVYGVTVVVTIIQNGFAALLTPIAIMQICIYLAMAALSAFIEASVISIMIAEPRKLLAIYRITNDKETKEVNLKMRLVFTNVGFVCFVMLIMLYINTSSTIRVSMYNEYLEKIVKQEMTADEAAQDYRNVGANVLHVPAEAIIFPLDNDSGKHHQGRTLAENLLMFFILIGIANLLQILTADETVRQIKSVSSKLKEMLAGSGDLTQRVEITQYDEVGHLVSDLNGLISSLQKTFLDVQKTSLVALESSSMLSKEIGETTGASEELAAGVTQVAKNVETNLNQVESTGKNLKEVFLALDHIITSVDSQAAFVNQTSSAVTEMAANVQSVSDATLRANNLSIQLSKAATEGNTAVSNSIQAIRKIEESSKKVTEMVSVISQIASQTNLLAMNAAIEAAHAGEAGKGFAVVANEVRSLAESSAKSAKEISVQIKKMLETVHNGVALSETAGSALNSISSDIGATAGLVKQIADAMTEQSLAANDILQSIANLVDETQSIKNNAIEQKRRNDVVRVSVERNTESMREIAQVTKHQSDEAQMILKSISDLKSIEMKNAEMAKDLAKLVNGFKLS